MVRIVPVQLAYNPKTLWFDAGSGEYQVNEHVVVETARGQEFGSVSDRVFEATDQQIASLKSPLKPVIRQATEEDENRFAELERRGREALPIFRKLAAEATEEMHPIAVEFLFDGDKAAFYFEAEERVDFRELVRKLAAYFHVRVDMKQIGVRDEARIVGGLGHCGQELCCRRLGGEFNPVTIKMAKEQDLSLNPQKISGLCGRLMCCLRYEYEAYKDFKGRAPKRNAKVMTPDGEAKVVDMNVPREIVSLQVEGEKAVRVPLSGMMTEGDAARPNAVTDEAWEQAHANEATGILGISSINPAQLTADDELAEAPDEAGREGKMDGKGGKQKSQRQRRSRSNRKESEQAAGGRRKAQPRRSTKLSPDGSIEAKEAATTQKSPSKSGQKSGKGNPKPKTESSSTSGSGSGSRRRRRRSSSSQPSGRPAPERHQKATDYDASSNRAMQPGRNSSALRGSRPNQGDTVSRSAGNTGSESSGASGKRRRVRRRHSSNADSSAES